MRLIHQCMLGIFIACLVAPAATPHRLVPNDETHIDANSALAIQDPNVSQLVLHEVTQQAPTVWITFTGSAGDSLFLQLGVPAIDGLNDYFPSVALVGPGLPAADLPFGHPAGTGAIVFDAADYEPTFFSEPFTGTESWIYVETTVTLPEDGTYYIVGYHADELPGKLWVAFGSEEAFGLQDILAYPDTLRDVRAFHEVSDQPLGVIPRLFLFFASLLQWLIGWFEF